MFEYTINKFTSKNYMPKELKSIISSNEFENTVKEFKSKVKRLPILFPISIMVVSFFIFIIGYFKLHQPFPWIYLFSFFVNIPMLLSLIILTGVRWQSNCSFIGTFLIIYIFLFIGNLLYSLYFHKTMLIKKPRHCVTVVSDCGFSSFFLYTGISVVIFIICEFIRKGTEYTECLIYSLNQQYQYRNISFSSSSFLGFELKMTYNTNGSSKKFKYRNFITYWLNSK
ncbi:hypothetical protein ACTFIY_003109 [Dictyostelium cf. discoideum]